MDVGVASPMAQGQAIISTETPATNACDRTGDGPNIAQTATVTSATTRTAGTNQSVTRSTNPWIGSRAPWACCTIRMICARVVSSPTDVTRQVRLPVPFTVPPVTGSPAVLRSGMGSPVIMLSSIPESPLMIVASVGSRSPGRIRISSPTARSAISTSTQSAPRLTRAVFGCSPINFWIASPVRPFARASSQRPSRISAMIAAAASKYTSRAVAGKSWGTNNATIE